MRGNYKLMRENEHLGNFTIDSGADIFEYTATAGKEIQPLLFKLALRGAVTAVLSGDVVKSWLAVRAPDSNNEFIDALLERIGATEYDPFAFVEYNAGKFNTDSFYLLPY